MITYTIVRSRRKTASISITKDMMVEVRAPLQMPQTDIDSFVRSAEKWIVEHLAKTKQLHAEKAAFALGYGDTALLRGKEYPIIAATGNRAGFDGEKLFIPPALSPELVKETLVQIYRNLAKKLLASRVSAYAAAMKVTPTAVKISGAKTRWGSCSDKNSLNFSWRLIMAADGVIDYIVVHELAHIIEHNHSPRFWAIVEGVLPDHKERQKRLKSLQQRLMRENWD